MKKLLASAAVALMGLVALTPALTPAAPGSDRERFKVSAFGVQRQVIKEVWTPAPCQKGGSGGGLEGTLVAKSRMTWETKVPGNADYVKLPGGQGLLVPLPVSRRNPDSAPPTKVEFNREVTNNVRKIVCDVEGNPLPAPDPRKIGTDCPRITSNKFLFRFNWEPPREIDTIFAPAGNTGAQLGRIYEGCYNNFLVNEGLHVDIPVSNGELASRKIGKVIATQRFTKKEPGVNEGGLVLTNQIAGKTYLTLVRR